MESDPVTLPQSEAAGSASEASAGLLSKRQLKRKARKESLQASWKDRRVKEREKRKEKKRQRREMGLPAPVRKAKNYHPTEITSTVVIDASFDSLMVDKEIRSMAQQINYCYSSNLRSVKPFDLYVTSYGERLEQALLKREVENWKIALEPRPYIEIFAKERLVYLTSESPNVLQSLDKDTVYIIGGIVDHNRYKGLTFKKATEQGIAHARLPIDEYVELKARKVLAINHVMEILCNFAETGEWASSLQGSIPARKGPEIKKSDSSNPLKEEEEE